jgi:hypothetical protein
MEQPSQFSATPAHWQRRAFHLMDGARLNQHQVQLVVELLVPQPALFQSLLMSLCMPCGQQIPTPSHMRAEQVLAAPIQQYPQQRSTEQHSQPQQTPTHVPATRLQAGMMAPQQLPPEAHTRRQVQWLLATSP